MEYNYYEWNSASLLMRDSPSINHLRIHWGATKNGCREQELCSSMAPGGKEPTVLWCLLLHVADKANLFRAY